MRARTVVRTALSWTGRLALAWLVLVAGLGLLAWFASIVVALQGQ